MRSICGTKKSTEKRMQRFNTTEALRWYFVAISQWKERQNEEIIYIAANERQDR